MGASRVLATSLEIFNSLIANGIDINTDVSIINETISKKNKLNLLWDVSTAYLDGCKTSKRRISELYSLLSKKPYKLKQGFLDFWIPAFLFIQRNEFALFNEYGYIPNLNEDIIEYQNIQKDMKLKHLILMV